MRNTGFIYSVGVLILNLKFKQNVLIFNKTKQNREQEKNIST